jgi:hypothetical protein
MHLAAVLLPFTLFLTLVVATAVAALAGALAGNFGPAAAAGSRLAGTFRVCFLGTGGRRVCHGRFFFVLSFAQTLAFAL